MTVSLSKSRISALVALAAIASGVLVAACSDDTGTSIQAPYDAGKPTPTTEPTTEPTTDAGSDAAETTDAETTADAGTDAPAAVNPCTSYVDFSSFHQVDISVTAGDAGLPVYVNPCARIKVGDKADFNMNFSNHPLVPIASTPANPIVAQSAAVDGNDYQVTFNTAGTYLYYCGIHTTSMRGAIEVVP